MQESNDPGLKSWVESTNDPTSDFSVQNLPFGVFSAGGAARVSVAIGDQILDLARLEEAGAIGGGGVFAGGSINRFMAEGPDAWQAARSRISAMLQAGSADQGPAGEALVAMKDANLHLPIEVADYTDFYSSREHASNVGAMFRDADNPLLPNWPHIPVPITGADAPIFSPCRRLDIELEMGTVVGTPNAMGTPLTVSEAQDAIFGYVLLNDWSARDIQTWEYVPLGPFQSKVFATTISPWVVMRQALESFRAEGPVQDPAPLPYLTQDGPMNYDMELEVTMRPDGADAATICRTNMRYLYWSSAQQLAHHAIGGCAMRTGDLLGSGTISGPTPDSFGSLLELTWNGKNPLNMADGSERTFIEDGDELVLKGWCQGDAYRGGFGECAGKILPSPDSRW